MTIKLRTVRSLTLALSVSLLPCGLASAAHAQGAYPSEGQRNVEYYVQHPDVRNNVNRACLNDPGHYRNNPDCWNAEQANTEAAARQTHKMVGDTSDPRTPLYWDKRPNERQFKINLCRQMTPEHVRASSTCGPAAQSLIAERNTGANR